MSNEQLVDQIRKDTVNRPELLEQLYQQNRPIIFQSVKSFINAGLEEDDAMQTAYFGLLEAVDRYDPERGLFATYLPYWVKAAVSRSMRNTGSVKRIPSYMTDLIGKYSQFRQRWQQETGQDPDDHILRLVLGISQEMLDRVRLTIREKDACSISDQITGAEDLTLEDAIPDPLVDVEGDAIAAVDDDRDAVRIWEAVDNLPENRAEVIRLRYKGQKTMTATGEALGISRERARQQEDKALRALKRNKTILQIGKSRGYGGSKMFHGSLGRFRDTGSSIVEAIVLHKLEPPGQMGDS